MSHDFSCEMSQFVYWFVFLSTLSIDPQKQRAPSQITVLKYREEEYRKMS